MRYIIGLVYLLIAYRIVYNLLMPYLTIWRRKKDRNYSWAPDVILDIVVVILVFIFNVIIYFYIPTKSLYENYIFIICVSSLGITYAQIYIISNLYKTAD